ncbi:MAG TPA: hypothetical protein VMR37_00810 [Rhabdochlamydiaceae bacterium]|nr:hypothetical protein [Rhabdochlamydiaceae bacterium]
MVTSCTSSSYNKLLQNPLCSVYALQTRIAKIFYLVIGSIIGLIIYRLLTDRSVSLKPPPTRMGEVLEFEEQVQALTETSEINGVSIKTIELLAQAHFCHDHLLDHLKLSWEYARKLHVTHIEIANVLDAICVPYKDCPHGFTTTVSQQLPLHLSKLSVDTPQSLTITVFRHMDEKPMNDIDIFRPNSTPMNNSCIGIEIWNPTSGSRINWTPIRGEFIRKYGFYFLQIEFLQVTSVLTGRVRSELKNLLLRSH